MPTIGINLLLWTAQLRADHAPILAQLQALGYQGVEVPHFAGPLAEAAQAGQLVRDAGLIPAMIGTLPDAAHNPLSPDPVVAQAGRDHLRWLVDCAQAMGAVSIAGPFTQPLGLFTGTGPTAAEWDRLVSAHQQMADHAGPDLRLIVEPLNRFECYILTTAADAARLVADVNRPNYRYLYDSFHAHIEEKSPVAALQATLAAVGQVHISENDRGIPGRGHAALIPTLQVLAKENFDGWISVEAFGQALPDLAAATRIWRPLFQSETDLITEAIALIRQGLATTKEPS